MDPEVFPEIVDIIREYGVDIIEEGPELLEKVGEGVEKTVHAILYPIDTAKEVIDYFEGPEPLSAPNIDWQDHEETTMRSSSVSHEDPPPL